MSSSLASSTLCRQRCFQVDGSQHRPDILTVAHDHDADVQDAGNDDPPDRLALRNMWYEDSVLLCKLCSDRIYGVAVIDEGSVGLHFGCALLYVQVRQARQAALANRYERRHLRRLRRQSHEMHWRERRRAPAAHVAQDATVTGSMTTDPSEEGATGAATPATSPRRRCSWSRFLLWLSLMLAFAGLYVENTAVSYRSFVRSDIHASLMQSPGPPDWPLHSWHAARCLPTHMIPSRGPSRRLVISELDPMKKAILDGPPGYEDKPQDLIVSRPVKECPWGRMAPAGRHVSGHHGRMRHCIDEDASEECFGDSLWRHRAKWRHWSARVLPKPQRLKTSAAELYFLSHLRSCAACASGATRSGSSSASSAVGINEILPRAVLVAFSVLATPLRLAQPVLVFASSNPLKTTSSAILLMGPSDLSSEAWLVANALLIGVHLPISECRVMSAVSAWVLYAWTPPWVRLTAASYCGLCAPEFAIEAGTPLRSERSSALPRSVWETSLRGQLRTGEEFSDAARRVHTLLQAASTPVDSQRGAQHSGLSQDLMGLDLAGTTETVATPCRRKSSRSPRRMPGECSRIRSSSTPPAESRRTGAITMVVRMSTPPSAASESPLTAPAESQHPFAMAVEESQVPPESQDSCFSFGPLSTATPRAAAESVTADSHQVGHFLPDTTVTRTATCSAALESSDIRNMDSELGDTLATGEPQLPEPLAAGESGIGARDSQDNTGDMPAESAPAQSFQAPMPTPPLAVPGQLSCPFCSTYSTRGPTRGLMCHITCRHQGCVIDERARIVLSALERGMCADSDCGSMRICNASRCPRCPKCGSSSPPRPILVGDVVGGRQAATTELDATLSEPSAPTRTHVRRVRRRTDASNRSRLPDGLLPANFIERVRALPAATILHIPIEMRPRLCSITAMTLEGLVAGDERASLLEEARSKLLFGYKRKGQNLRVELSTRLMHWYKGEFETLLIRAEETQRDRAQGARRQRVCSSMKLRGTRARRIARDGAYGKGVSTLHTEVANLSEADQARWSSELLPRSAEPPRACVSSITTAQGTTHDAGQLEGQSRQASTPQPFRHALAGIRFPALSAPGPSGMRPEHLKEMLSIRQRGVANRLYRAIDALRQSGERGTLPNCAKWILASRLVFIKKKKGPAPRPIRVGEVWRRLIAKGLVHEQRSQIQAFTLKCRQMGVAMPGGAEALIHLRAVAEELLASKGEQVVAVLDLDFRNAFPSLEWPSIRSSVAAHFPQLLPWTEWCQSEPAPVLLPSGQVIRIDRGAEQGDPLGSLYCAVVLADVVERARGTVQRELAASDTPCPRPFVDMWYMDDCEVFCDPSHVDVFLRCLDVEAAKVGATRGSGADVKSFARLCGPADAVEQLGDSWVTSYIQRTCKVGRPNVPVEVLGAELHRIGSQFEEVTERVRTIHTAISIVEHVPTELVLTRRCADICKVTHLLRAAGPLLSREHVEAFDSLMRSSVERILGGPLHEDAWDQCSAGVRDGGLGFRRASDLALPAFVASRIEAQPLVASLAVDLTDAGLIPNAFEELYEAQTAAAFDGFLAALTPEGQRRARQCLEDARQTTRDAFAELRGLRRRPVTDNPGITMAAALILPAGGEDPEYADGEPRGLQNIFASIVDDERLDTLASSFELTSQHESARRIRELRDPSVSNDWLWALNPAHGAYLPSSHFLTAVRLRVGFHFLDEPILCPRCCRAILDRSCVHALCCASAESTRGHNRVRDSVLQFVSLADGAADTEVPELIPSAPTLRPADIFTPAALPGCQAALDVGIMSPDATGAGLDCCDAMHRKKLQTYEPYLEELERQNIRYVPLAFSSYGRVHPEAAATFATIAQQAARRKGLASHNGLLRRAMASVGVQLWKRAAAMVTACLPRETREEVAMLFGDAFDGNSSVASTDFSDDDSTTDGSWASGRLSSDEESDVDVQEVVVT